MKIIGLCGEKGSGKDSVYEILSKNYKSKRFAFADPLKESLKSLFHWDNDNFSSKNKELVDNYWGVSPRQMCQILGTDIIRNTLSNKFDKNVLIDGNNFEYSFWIKRINKEYELYIDSLIDNDVYIIFTDVRFIDELKYIKSLGGKIYKINRPNIKINDYSFHESEKVINKKEFNDEVNGIILNDGSLKDLTNKVINLFRE